MKAGQQLEKCTVFLHGVLVLVLHTDIATGAFQKLSPQVRAAGATLWMVSQDSQSDTSWLPRHMPMPILQGDL